MKKIITFFAPLAIVAGIFGFTARVHAQYAPLQVMNATSNPNCNFSQCGSSSVSAKPGDIISVQIFYNNPGQTTQNITLSLSPKTQGPSQSFSVSGGASNASQGTVTINLSSGSETMTAMMNTARWYKDRNTTPITVPIDSLFSNSFNVGWVQGAQTSGGISVNQGVLVVDFQISNSGNTNNGGGNQTYACNDGYDNDGDGLVDANDPGCSSGTDNDEYNYVTVYQNIRYGCMDQRAYNYDSSANRDDGSCRYNNTNYNNYQYQNQYQQPTAVTTVGTGISSSSAQINGLAYANGNTTNAWFEWGITRSLGNKTPTQSIGTAQGATMQSTLYNLDAGTIYFFRAAAQNGYGISYGDIMTFRTLNGVNTNTDTNKTVETKIVYVKDTSSNINLQAVQKVPSLLALKLEEMGTNACVGNNLSYTLTYQNVSKKTVSNAVVQIVFPKEISFDRSSAGSYDSDTRTLTYPVGTLTANQSGQILVMAKVSEKPVNAIVVTTATMVYTNPDTLAQEDVIAYMIHRTDQCSNNSLGAAALFGYGFLPTTLFGWILLILAILLLVIVARVVYDKTRSKKEEVPNLPR